jgi:catechol 2,3-dioxygenase-like lactoylglutathione lyase family enzyme
MAVKGNHRMAPAIDGNLRKFHASLNVSDLDRSIAFYRVLLGAEPAKVRTDYAKFDIAEPPLVLSLVPGKPGAGGSLNHVGLRVPTADELVEVQRRLEAAGMPTQREEGVECCYALQTKFWIADPDRVLWEVYVFHDDVAEHGKARAPRADTILIQKTLQQPPQAWEHHLSEPIPSRIPHDDNTLHEVRLEGTVNLRPDAANRETLFGEVLRALQPGAPVYIRGLAGDAPVGTTLALAGPAAAVQHVPATGDVIGELARAGFADVHIEKLSSTAYFVIDGVPLREVRVVGRKPGHRPATKTHHAIYLGPLGQVTDDYGNVFRKGVPTPLNVHDWQTLAKGAAAASFLLLEPAGFHTDVSCCGPPVPAAAGKI